MFPQFGYIDADQSHAKPTGVNLAISCEWDCMGRMISVEVLNMGVEHQQAGRYAEFHKCANRVMGNKGYVTPPFK